MKVLSLYFYIIFTLLVISCRNTPTIPNIHDPKLPNYNLQPPAEFYINKNLALNQLQAVWSLQYSFPLTGFLIYSSEIDHDSQYKLIADIDSSEALDNNRFVQNLNPPETIKSYYKIVSYYSDNMDTLFSEARYDSIEQHVFRFTEVGLDSSATQIRWGSNFISEASINIQYSINSNNYTSVYAGDLKNSSVGSYYLNNYYNTVYLDSLSHPNISSAQNWRFKLNTLEEETEFFEIDFEKENCLEFQNNQIFFIPRVSSTTSFGSNTFTLKFEGASCPVDEIIIYEGGVIPFRPLRIIGRYPGNTRTIQLSGFNDRQDYYIWIVATVDGVQSKFTLPSRVRF